MDMSTNPAPLPEDSTAESTSNKKTPAEDVLQCASIPVKWPSEVVELVEHYNVTRNELIDGNCTEEYTLADHREEFLDKIVGMMASHPEITHTMLLRAEAGQKAFEAEQQLMDERIGRKPKKRT